MDSQESHDQKDSDSDSESESGEQTQIHPQAEQPDKTNQQNTQSTPAQAAPSQSQFPPQVSPQPFAPQTNPQQFPPQVGYFPAPQQIQASPQNFPPQAYNTPISFNNSGAAPGGNYQNTVAPIYQNNAGHEQNFPTGGVPAVGYMGHQSPYVKPTYPNNNGTQGWTTGIFDCMDDPTNALTTVCCPCTTFGQVAEIVDSGNTTCTSSAIVYAAVAATGIPCLISSGYRQKLRSKYDLLEIMTKVEKQISTKVAKNTENSRTEDLTLQSGGKEICCEIKICNKRRKLR
ncbi:hypothetical protein ACHQM5_009314 [Ranunculus cassubicifolius]